MQLWKFRVIPVPGRSWYSYTLFLHEEGKPDKEVASFLHGGDISMQKSQDMTPFITGIGLVALDQPDGEKQKYKVRLISSRAGAWTNFSLPDAGHSVGYDPRPPLIAGSFRLRHIFAKTLTHPSQGIPYAKETYLCLKIEALASPPKRVAQRNER
jgi:hypothetical protein